MKHSILITILFTYLTIDLCAQWERVTTIPFGGNDYSLAVNENNIYHGTLFGLFYSSDNGSTWSTIDFGAVDSCVKTIIINGNYIYLGTPAEGVYVSDDSGLSWEARSSGLTNLAIHCFTNVGSSVFVATDGGVFVSDNEGISWTSANNGITNLEIRALTNLYGVLYTGSNGNGVYVSTNNGQSWTVENNGLASYYITHLFTFGSTVFVGTLGGLFKSTDNGNSWQNVNLGVTQEVLCSTSIDGDLYVGTNGGGVFYSTTNGDTWTAWNDGFQNQNVYCLAECGNEIFSGLCCGFGLWKRQQLSVGIEEEIQSGTLVVFPTPGNGILYFNYSGTISGEYHLKLVNLAGQVVLTKNGKFEAGECSGSLTVTHISEGAFIFILLDNDNKILAEEKVIILR